MSLSLQIPPFPTFSAQPVAPLAVRAFAPNHLPATIPPLSFLARRAADPETAGPSAFKLSITFAPPSSQARRGASRTSENFLPT